MPTRHIPRRPRFQPSRAQAAHPEGKRPAGTMSRRRFLANAGAIATVTSTAAVFFACDLGTAVEGGFAISAIEAVQSIQKADNSVPLVAGKRTIVRVFVFTAGTMPVANITGTLDIRSSSGSMLAHLTPIVSPTITAPTASTFDRANIGHSLLFELPPNTLHASVTVRAAVFLQSRPNPASSRSITLRFLDKPPQHVQPILISQPSAGLPAPTMSQFGQALQGARTRLPVAENGFDVAAPRFMSIPYAIVNDAAWYLLIAQLELIPLFLYGCVFDCPPGGIRAGLLINPPSSQSQFFGIGFPFPYGALASSAPTSPANLAGLQTVFAHEMTHAFGVFHDHDTCGAGIPWGDSPATINEPGFDVPSAQMIPRGSTELMSYCSDPRWPSTVTYLRVLNAIPVNA